MYKIQTVFIMIAWVLASWLTPGLTIAQEPFNETLMRPVGIATTPRGDIVVHSTIFAATVLTQFAPDRSVSEQNTIAKDPFEAELLENARLTLDPTGNAFYLLAPEGDLLVINAALQEIARFDLRALPVDTANVYDMKNGLSTNSLDLSQPMFGDLDVFMPRLGGSERIALCSGMANGIPFVMRFAMPSMGLEPTALKVVLMSTVAAPSAFNAPRGIAIAKDTGMALTTLPVSSPTPATCPDAIIKFDALEPENTVEILLDNDTRGIPSWGMTTDPQNNVYLTIGDSLEEPTCRQGGRASVLFVPSDLTGIDNSFSFGLYAPIRPQDVAVSPQTFDIYITLTDADTVARFQR